MSPSERARLATGSTVNRSPSRIAGAMLAPRRPETNRRSVGKQVAAQLRKTVRAHGASPADLERGLDRGGIRNECESIHGNAFDDPVDRFEHSLDGRRVVEGRKSPREEERNGLRAVDGDGASCFPALQNEDRREGRVGVRRELPLAVPGSAVDAVRAVGRSDAPPFSPPESSSLPLEMLEGRRSR